MRQLLISLILIAGLASAQYAEPPMDDVLSANGALLSTLAASYNSSNAVNTTLDIALGSHISSLAASASIEPIAITPSIDNVSCAVDGMAALIARGEEMDGLVALPSSGYPDFLCDPSYPQSYAWRCDFDSDNCAEYVNRSGVLYELLQATFIFKDLSVSVPFSSTVIPVPQEIRDGLDSASGNDSLVVEVSGDLTFFYEVNDRQGGFGGDCGSNYVMFNRSVPFSANRSFSVGGSKKLFFLESPVLREQWYRDNRFDVAVLSQCPLYEARIYENGNLSRSITLRTFSIATDEHGVQKIVSESTNATEGGWSELSSGVASPFQLEEENISYLFAYRFGYPYPGLGDNNLSITVRDVASDEASFNETIRSRMLSYQGSFAEDGSPFDPETARPSLATPPDSLMSVEIAFGLIAMIILVAFINSWLLGGS